MDSLDNALKHILALAVLEVNLYLGTQKLFSHLDFMCRVLWKKKSKTTLLQNYRAFQLCLCCYNYNIMDDKVLLIFSREISTLMYNFVQMNLQNCAKFFDTTKE